jgi:hypothetical protein
MSTMPLSRACSAISWLAASSKALYASANSAKRSSVALSPSSIVTAVVASMPEVWSGMPALFAAGLRSKAEKLVIVWDKRWSEAETKCA